MNSVVIFSNSDMGLYKFRKELLENLVQMYKVYIICPSGDYHERLKDIGTQVINIKLSRRSKNLFKESILFVKCFSILLKIHPNLLITYTIKPNIYGGIIALILHFPYISNITGLGTAFSQNNLLKNMIVNSYKLALKNVSTVFFENKSNRDIFLSNHIIPLNKTLVLNGAGVNLKEYFLTDYPDSETVHFLFIGRIMKEKGIDELLFVARKIYDAGLNVCFDIVGPMEDDYAAIFQWHHESHMICYHGFQDNVIPFITQCHCLILPSYHEGMANTLLEAGAMGRPLITSEIPGCMETVIEGKNGFFCKPKDSKSLLDAIMSFLSLSYDEKRAMGIYSNMYIKNHFDKIQVVQKTINKIGEIINVT